MDRKDKKRLAEILAVEDVDGHEVGDATEEVEEIFSKLRSDPVYAAELDRQREQLVTIQAVRRALGLTQQYVADEMGRVPS